MAENEVQTLSPANFEIMKIVWDMGKCTVNQVVDVLNSRRESKIGRTSVQVQMNRLEKYGWLLHEERNRSYIYSAVHTRDKAVTDIVSDIRHRVFGGSSAEFVKSLFRNSEINRDAVEEMKALLKEFSEGE